MKVKFVNTSLVFSKSEIENITGEYTLTLGYNTVSSAASDTTASVKIDDTYPNLTSYMADGYNRLKIVPKTNVKYIRLKCGNNGAAYGADSAWQTGETVLNLTDEVSGRSTFQYIRLALRYTVNDVDQNVMAMSDNLADWVTITLYKESSNS